jgi:transcription elongation factor GreA
MAKFPMTAEGHAMLQNELMHRQQVERPQIIQQIADARTDDSDLSENAEYHAAQELQEANESRSLRTSWRAPKSSTLLSYPGTP